MTTADLRATLHREFKRNGGDDLTAFFVSVETARNKAMESEDVTAEILDFIHPDLGRAYLQRPRRG